MKTKPLSKMSLVRKAMKEGITGGSQIQEYVEKHGQSISIGTVYVYMSEIRKKNKRAKQKPKDYPATSTEAFSSAIGGTPAAVSWGRQGKLATWTFNDNQTLQAIIKPATSVVQAIRLAKQLLNDAGSVDQAKEIIDAFAPSKGARNEGLRAIG